MTPDEKREISEKLGNAKKQLIDALKIAESANSVLAAKRIELICGRVESMQNNLMRHIKNR